MNSGYLKDIAHQAITKALRTGELQRPDNCATCGKFCKPYAHHEDDDKPLDVKWLCSRCHADRHKQLRAEQKENALVLHVELST